MRFSSLGEWLLILVPVVIVILVVLWFAGFGLPVIGTRSVQETGIGEGEISQVPLENPRIFSKSQNGWQYQITARYTYTIRAKIVGKEEYPETGGDQITPMDLAVAYGDVIKPGYFPYFSFSIENRQLTTTLDYPKYITMLPDEYWFSHITNNHLVFADETTLSAARESPVGDCVSIDGYLVDIVGKGPGGATITRTTSTTRSDEDQGGCEVVYVESFRTTPC